MFTVTVRDHVMIAHSFGGEVFGPGAAAARGDVRRGRELLRPGARPGRHRGRHRPGRPPSCTSVLADLNYRNLDDEAEFAGSNTSTEVMAR